MNKDKPQRQTQITHPEQVVGGGGRGAPTQKQPGEVNRFGLIRHNDLLALTCALASNQEHSEYSPNVLVTLAEQLLTEIEQRGK